MSQEVIESPPRFSQPVQQIFAMVVVLAFCVLGAFVALPQVMPVFEANPYLNGFIAIVFGIGIVSCFRMVFSLIVSVRWIERFASGQTAQASQAPRLVAPLGTLLRSRGAGMQLNTMSSQSILDSVAMRMDEGREITRYIINTLIFLGLLGTFYGLATTVPAVVDTIRSLAPQDGEGGVEVFNRLMTGLEAQLGGMGIAFASSLVGLAGSLIVGLLELFAGRGQNRFYRELEEWLSSITQVGLSLETDTDAASHEAELTETFIELLGNQVDRLHSIFARSELKRAQVDAQLMQLVKSAEERVTNDEKVDAILTVLNRLIEGQEKLLSAIETSGAAGGMDAESRMRLRSIDVQMQDIVDHVRTRRDFENAAFRAELAGVSPPSKAEPHGVDEPESKE